MGAQRYIYLSDELNMKLKKEPNASGLIQDLLIKHYDTIDPNKMSVKELEHFIQVEKIKQEYEEKMKLLENGH